MKKKSESNSERGTYYFLDNIKANEIQKFLRYNHALTSEKVKVLSLITLYNVHKIIIIHKRQTKNDHRF